MTALKRTTPNRLEHTFRLLIVNRDTNSSLITLSGKVTLVSALVAKVLWPFKRALSGKVPLTIAVVAKVDQHSLHTG